MGVYSTRSNHQRGCQQADILKIHRERESELLDPVTAPDCKWVDIEFEQWLDNPVALAAIKTDPFFADFDLVRISRLSVVPVSAARWKRLIAMSTRPR